TYTVLLFIAANLQKPFWTWMETDHIRKIWDTGLFRKITVQKAEEPSEDRKFRNKITYYPLSMEAWEKYKKEHQPKLVDEFKKEFAEQLTEGGTFIEIDRIFGKEEVLFTSK